MNVRCHRKSRLVRLRIVSLASLLILPLLAAAQTLDIHDAVKSYAKGATGQRFVRLKVTN